MSSRTTEAWNTQSKKVILANREVGKKRTRMEGILDEYNIFTKGKLARALRIPPLRAGRSSGATIGSSQGNLIKDPN